MENWQINHIDGHLAELVDLTRCTAMVKAWFISRNFITYEEEDYMTKLGKNYGHNCESKELYVILKTRKGGYDALLQVLKETHQTGALHVLTTISYSVEVEDDQVKALFKLPVKIFGQVTELQKAFPSFAIEDAHEILKCLDARKELCKLMHSDRAVLPLDATLPDEKNFHIPRYLSNRLLLDPKVFKLDCTDVFVFKGININALVKLVAPHVTRSSTEQLSIVTCRHIHLNEEEDWDDMTLVCDHPIHLVVYEDEQYVLQRTSEVTDIIRSYCTNDSSRTQDAYLPEKDFAEDVVSDLECKGALICDVPGMGKTWLMEKLAWLLRSTAERVFVFFIELSSFSKSITEVHSSHEDRVLNFVFKYAFRDELARILLKQQFDRIDSKVVLVFDGFDEISDAYVERTTHFLSLLKKRRNTNLVISSRPQMRRHLEKTFGVISYDILPFGIENQVKAMVAHWIYKCPSADRQTLNEFALKCVATVDKIQSQDSRDILGVPLKCYILAVLNETQASRVSTVHLSKRPIKIDEMATIKTVSDLFRKFIDFSSAKLGLNHLPVDVQQNMSSFHTFKALELLFPEVGQAYKSILKVDPRIVSAVQKAGIMCYTDVSGFTFVHRSFAEYFAGRFFAEFWMSLVEYEPSFVETVGTYFLKNVIQSFWNDVAVKKVIDKTRHYPISKYESVKVAEFRSHAVLLFMKSVYNYKAYMSNQSKCAELFKQAFFVDTLKTSIPWFNHTLRVNSFKDSFGKEIYQLLLACIDNRFHSLLSLLVHIVRKIFDTEEIPNLILAPVNILGRDTKKASLPLLLSRIAANGSPEMAREVFNLFQDSNDNYLMNFCRMFSDDYFSPLDVAIGRNDLDMVVFFKDKMNLTWQELLVKCLLTQKRTVDDVNARATIIQKLIGTDRIPAFFRTEKIVTYFHSENATLFFHINIKILKCLDSEKHLSLKSACWENKALLLKLGLYTNDVDLIKLLRLLFGKCYHPEKVAEIECLSNQPLEFGDVSASRILQALDKEDAKNIFLKLRQVPPKYIGDQPELFKNLLNVETLKLLVALCSDFSKCNWWEMNYLHFACVFGKVDWAELLIESGYDVNQQDSSGNPPLLYITQKRGLELINLLVENGANIYAVTKRKTNCLDRFLQNGLIFTDSVLVSAMISYTKEKGFTRLWRMPDIDGKTPLELVKSILGQYHPEYVCLIQETSEIRHSMEPAH